MLQAYLSQYPNGAFAPLARAKIGSLERRQKEDQEQKARAQQLAAAPAPPPRPSITPEQALWDAIKDADNPAMFQGYLDRYPNGVFAQAAAVKLAALRPPPAPPTPTPAPAPPPALPPAQQAAAPVAPESTGSSADRWQGRGSVWRFDLRLVGDQLSGTGRSEGTSGEFSVSGRVNPASKEVSALLSHPRMFAPARIAGRFPTLVVITNGPGSDTVVVEPVGGGTPRPAAPIATNAPAVQEGRWQGRGASWQLDLRLTGDQLTGTGRSSGRSGEFSFSGRVDPASKAISGIASHPGQPFSMRIAGRFPTIEIVTANSGSDTVQLQHAP